MTSHTTIRKIQTGDIDPEAAEAFTASDLLEIAWDNGWIGPENLRYIRLPKKISRSLRIRLMEHLDTDRKLEVILEQKDTV